VFHYSETFERWCTFHPDYKLGNTISKLRRSRSLTQEQTIAKLEVMGVSVSKSRYAKIETDRINIRVREMVALKRIFKCSFNDFFDGLEDLLQSEMDRI